MELSKDQSRFVSPLRLWMIRHPRAATAAVTIVAILMVAALIVAAQPQPVIALEFMAGMGPNYYTSGQGYILVSGKLSNSGGADGYAVVNWLINNEVVQQVRYLVPSNQWFYFTLYQPWYGAAVLSSDLVLLSVQRA